MIRFTLIVAMTSCTNIHAIGADDTSTPIGEVLPCLGGGAPFVELGIETGDHFTALADGDPLDVYTGTSNELGLLLQYRLGGLDSSTSLSVLVRVDLDDGSTNDYPAIADTACEPDGRASYQAFAAFPSEYQNPDGLDDLNGRLVTIGTSFTDNQGIAAYQERQIEISYTAVN